MFIVAVMVVVMCAFVVNYMFIVFGELAARRLHTISVTGKYVAYIYNTYV